MAKNSIIQMFTTTVGDAAASIDLQDDGSLLGVHAYILTNSMAATDDGGAAELSFGSTSSFLTNDARQVIATIAYQWNLVGAAGGAQSAQMAQFNFQEGLPFFGGERLYIHTANLGAGVMQRAVFQLLLAFKNGPVSRRR